MQVKNKIIIAAIIVVIIIASVAIYFVSTTSNKNKSYYYTYEKDNNLITQSVRIYDNRGKLQTKYYILKDDNPVSYTKGESAVLLIKKIDLEDKPVIEISFEKNPKKVYKVSYKK